MADTLTRADVERIATLARLELTPDEVTLFAGQLTGILAYADQVQQVDTSGVPPTAHIAVAVGDWRRSRRRRRRAVARSRPRPDPGAGADRAAGLVKVPRVLGS